MIIQIFPENANPTSGGISWGSFLGEFLGGVSIRVVALDCGVGGE
jgi:hypothetical protein